MKHWIYTALVACIAMVLITASTARAVPILHMIEFTPQGGPAQIVGDFTVDDSLLTPFNMIEGPVIFQTFNVTFMGSVWQDPNFFGPPFGDSVEIIAAFMDATGDIFQMAVVMLDNNAPGSGLDPPAELCMAAGVINCDGLGGGGALGPGSFRIASAITEGTYTITAVGPVPEPSTLLLLGFGLAGLGFFRRRTKIA